MTLKSAWISDKRYTGTVSQKQIIPEHPSLCSGIRSLLGWFSFLSLQEFEKLSDFFKTHYRLELMEKDLCVKGWNWGTVKFGGESSREIGGFRGGGKMKDTPL